MTLSDLAIKRPVLAWMLMFGLIVFGGICATRMGVSQLPSVDFPVITVSLSLQGAAPEVMETDVVDVVEGAVMSIQGVTQVTSSSRNGSASVTVQFDLSRNIDLAQQDVQSVLQQVARQLPKEMDPPIVTKTNPDDSPIMYLTLTSDKHTMRELMYFTRDTLQEQFSTVPGVGTLSLGGYVAPAMRIWVDDKKLDQYNLTVQDVINTVSLEHQEPPAGFVQGKGGTFEYNVRTLGEAVSAEGFGALRINTRGGAANYLPIHLRNVAEVEDGLANVRRISRGNSVPAVSLAIVKQRGSNEVAVADAVFKRIKEVQKTLPDGMVLAVNVDNSKFVKESVKDLEVTLLLSAILTAAVCWGFLGSWSSTLNVLLAIPTSVVGTFIVLYFCGFTLNTFSLMALSLAIGIVVDDAIMVLENIMRYQEEGHGKMTAAILGARQITFAAIATTAAIVAIFLPVVFMQGIIGRYFFEFGITMTVAVLLSLLEALTLTPMRCSEFVSVEPRTTRFGKGVEALLEWARDGYHGALKVLLKHPWWTVIASVVFFLVSLISVRYVKLEMVPPQDQSRFLARFTAPPGSSLATTDAKIKEVEKILASRPEVDHYYTAVGGFGGGDVSTGIAFVTLKDKGKRGIDKDAHHELGQFELMAALRKQLGAVPGLRTALQDLSTRGFTASRGFPVEFTVQGPDWDALAANAQKVTDELKATGLVTDIDTDYRLGQPEIHVVPDRNLAAQRGVSVAAIGQVINAMIAGVTVGQFPKNGHRYDVIVQMKGEDSTEPVERIKRLFLRNNRGELIRMSDVVKIEQKPTLQAINRLNRERAVTVYANVAPGKSQQEALNAVQAIGKKVLPDGYKLRLSGSSDDFNKSLVDLGVAFILGIFVAYMVLGSQFNSFIDPITVLIALPFSVTGALMALWAGHQSLNIYSGIGIILVAGIVKKNSIMLVEFTNEVREAAGKGKDVTEALLEACPVRLRPILMTSIAIVVGAIPPALALGPGAETRVPMADTVIGGVLVAMVLTLFVVPCVYLLFSRMGGDHRIIDIERLLADDPLGGTINTGIAGHAAAPAGRPGKAKAARKAPPRRLKKA